MGNGCASGKAVQTATNSISRASNLKIVVVGETLSGKTSIVRRYEKNYFQSFYEPTKSLDIVSIVKKINVPNQKIISIELWEVPAHESMEMKQTYFQKADAAIVVMDLSDENAYHYAAQWKNSIRQHRSTLSLRSSQQSSNPNDNHDFIPVLLLGNKFDVIKQAFLNDQLHNATNSVSSDERTLFPKFLNRTHSKKPDGQELFEQKEREEKADDENNNMQINGTLNSEASRSKRSSRVSMDAETNPVSNIGESNGQELEMTSANDKTEEKKETANQESNGERTSTNQEAAQKNSTNQETSSNQESVLENSSNQKTTQETAQENSTSNQETANENLTNQKTVQKQSSTNHLDVGQNPAIQDANLSKKDEASSLQDSNKNNHETNSNHEEKDSKPDKNAVSPVISLRGENNQNVDGSGQEGDQPEQMEVSDSTSARIRKPSKETNVDSEIASSELETEKAERRTSVRSHKKLKKIFPKDLNDDHEKLIDQISLESPTSLTFDVALLTPYVAKLERFAEDNGFLAGIPVSAKESKGGVHEAIQSLLRHLINKKSLYPDRKRRSHEVVGGRKRIKKNLDLAEEFEALQEVGIIEIDEVLKMCNSPLRTAEHITSAYREAMREFKQACVAAHLVAGKRVNVEECIAALKEAIESPQLVSKEKSEIRMALLLRDQPKYSLSTIDKDGFISLQIVDQDANEVEDEGAISDHITSVLQLYQQKVHAACCLVLQNYGELDQQLDHHLVVMADKEEKAWDLAVAAGRSQVDVRRILTGLAQARARMRGTLELVRDTKKDVVNLQSKIRAVLLF